MAVAATTLSCHGEVRSQDWGSLVGRVGSALSQHTVAWD